MEASDMQRQLKIRCKGALTHRAVRARMPVYHTYVFRQVAAARKCLIASHAVGNGVRPVNGTSANFRQVLGRLSAMHRRHVVTEKRRRFQYGVALGAAESVVGFPHVEGERHAAAEELGALVAVELDSAVHEITVLVEIRTIGERFPADVTRQLLLRRPHAVVRRFCFGAVEHRMAHGAAQLGMVCTLVAHQRVDPFKHGRALLARKL